jgi:hypothetical protein
MSKHYRLPSDLRADLEWLWTQAESELMIRSCQGGQEAILNRRSPPERKAPPRAPKLKKPTEAERRAALLERWSKKDDDLRLMWQTLSVHETVTVQHHEVELSARFGRVHRTVCRMAGGAHGHAHARVLFRVYGDPSQGLEKDELRNLERYAASRETRSAMLGAASKAYAAAHDAETAERKAVRRVRLDSIGKGASPKTSVVRDAGPAMPRWSGSARTGEVAG